MVSTTVSPPLTSATPRAAFAVLILAVLAIGGAWFSQLVLGLKPCELCLLQRWPYYIGLPLAFIAALLSHGNEHRSILTALLLVLALIFVGSAGLGIYHAGVERKFWAGPSACTGGYVAPASTDDFLKSLDGPAPVRCDQAAMRVLGLSLAGWNALISLLIAAIAWRGATAARRG